MAKTFLQDKSSLDTALNEFTRKLKEEEAVQLAKASNLSYINLRNFPIDLKVLAMLTEDEAKQAESVIFYNDKDDLRIGTINPKNNLLILKVAEWETKYKVSLYVISTISYTQTLAFYSKVSHAGKSRDETIRAVGETFGAEDLKSIADPEVASKISLTDLLTRIFGASVAMGSSDIHMEPENDFIKVRFRLDGVLQDMLHLPKSFHKQIVSRIKIQSKIKLNVENVPQDGRMSFFFGEQSIDVRVSTLPSAFGESIVMRLLNSAGLTVGFNELGFRGTAYEVVHNALNKPNGMVITTGPTGSGKTTTLYSFLKELNEEGVKIITLEDPVEYKVEGITQTPIDHNADFSFAKGLKAILRQDPDIVMVGEIRDEETADTASQAALTGHIVLSTLHTNDAAGAIPRLYNMGVKAFVIAPALNCIIAQRLVRKICQKCKTQDEITPETQEKIKNLLSTVPKNSKREIPEHYSFQKGVGCDACHGLGYKGRIGIFEVIDMTEGMQELVQKEPTMGQIKKQAIQDGMVTLTQDGILKAIEGITDLAEVFRVAGI